MSQNLVPFPLNASAAAIAVKCLNDASLRVRTSNVAGATVLDFGVEAEGGLAAGLALAGISASGLASVAMETGTLHHRPWPHVTFRSDWPLAACLLSQYAGWQIAVGKYFAMGSGPMRAIAAVESIFEELSYRELSPAVGVLESARLPDESAIAWLCNKLRLAPDRLTLCVARTASLAGTVQVVARSVETALHKLHEQKFDVARVRCGHGSAPLPPVAADDLGAIGRTNDAILYGSSVTLWVTGDDASIEEIGPRVPSSASPQHGQPFGEVFADAGRDFYKIDPMLFSPAEVTFQNMTTGSVFRFGSLEPDVLASSFGLV